MASSQKSSFQDGADMVLSANYLKKVMELYAHREPSIARRAGCSLLRACPPDKNSKSGASNTPGKNANQRALIVNSQLRKGLCERCGAVSERALWALARGRPKGKGKGRNSKDGKELKGALKDVEGTCSVCGFGQPKTKPTAGIKVVTQPKEAMVDESSTSQTPPREESPPPLKLSPSFVFRTAPAQPSAPPKAASVSSKTSSKAAEASRNQPQAVGTKRKAANDFMNFGSGSVSGAGSSGQKPMSKSAKKKARSKGGGMAAALARMG